MARLLFAASAILAIFVAVSASASSPLESSTSLDISLPRTGRHFFDPFHTFLELNRRRRQFLRFRRRCRRYSWRFRSFGGICNNRRHIKLGNADTPFLLLSPRRGKKPTGKKRPNARVVSNKVCSERAIFKNRRRMSELVTYFGQFLDHTFSETENSNEQFPIIIPKNDPVYKKGGFIPFFRTRKQKTRRGYAAVNMLTSFIDAASVYGAHKATADKLRTFRNGKLKTSKGNLLLLDSRGFFVSGDKRVNENPALTAMHTLFMREHNRLCNEIRRAFPWWPDEKTYQVARKIVGAEMQSVVYHEFLPTVLGRKLPYYRGYRPWVNPSLSDEFSTVGYRVGHTLINKHFTFMNKRMKRRTLNLRAVFFNPKFVRNGGIDDIIRGAMNTKAGEVDPIITGEVRNFLLGSPNGRISLDLAALNIQRGRDHGVPSYNQMRRLYGLRPVRYFWQITRNRRWARALKNTYGHVNKIDAWVGGLSEDHQRPGSLGPLFRRIWIREFIRLRDGDRFYYERWNSFPWRQRIKIPTLRRLLNGYLQGNTMRHLIIANTNIPRYHVPWNVFKVLW